MHFRYAQKVLFKHYDPAGIVFFPRYAEMVNDAVEAMFSDLIGWPFEDMHPDAGVPTAAISPVFQAPSRHGAPLELQLTIVSLGRSSMGLRTEAVSAGETRFTADQTIVCIDANGRPQRWPETVHTQVHGVLDGKT